MTDKIIVNDKIYLSPPEEKDIPDLVNYLNTSPEIFRRTIRIPFPYTEKDAKDFIKYAQDKSKEYNRIMEWAIRNNEGRLLGMIGWHGKYGVGSFKDEIGFWLGKEHQGKGIMKAVLKKMCDLGINEYGLKRIEGYIFSFNIHSVKVCERCGFVPEGTLRKAVLKEGAYFDVKLYALVVD